MVKDPVCEMEIDEAHASKTIEHDGTTYYFCSLGCASKFEKDPGAYVKEQAAG